MRREVREVGLHYDMLTAFRRRISIARVLNPFVVYSMLPLVRLVV